MSNDSKTVFQNRPVKAIFSVLIFVAALALLLGYFNLRGIQNVNNESDAFDHSAETPSARAARLRPTAPETLCAACLQAVTGFTRIIEPGLDDIDDNPNNWQAAPTLEYVNAIGGVQRTNLPFTFSVHFGELFCAPDLAKLSARDSAQFDAAIRRDTGN